MTTLQRRTTTLNKVVMQFAPVMLCGLLLVGCGSTSTVRGRVVPGEIGVVTVVPTNDDRLLATTQGIPGIKVEMRKSQTVISSATSNPDGSFTMKLDNRSTGTRYDIVATGPGIFPVRSTSYPPQDGQTLLIIADTRAITPER